MKQSTAGTTVYVYDAKGNLAAEYGPQTSAACTICYVTVDHLGSTRALTDEQGNVVKRHDYMPFGDEIFAGTGGRTTAQNYGTDPTAEVVHTLFTGKYRDTDLTGSAMQGLDYFGSRYLSGEQGRFTSPDKPFVDQHPEDPQTWNLYAYVRNNPLRLIDVEGNVARKPVPGATAYTYRPDLNNQNDNPNFHIFNKKGHEVGRISVQEIQTGEVNAADEPMTELGYEVTGDVPNAVIEGIQGIVQERGILPRFSINGGPFWGFTLNALGVLSIASNIAAIVAETANTGIGMNLAPWNAGSLYIADPKKAAASLGNGTYINFTDKKGAMTLYQVRDGKFIRVGCRGNGDDCELTDPAGRFQIVNGMMMN